MRDRYTQEVVGVFPGCTESRIIDSENRIVFLVVVQPDLRQVLSVQPRTLVSLRIRYVAQLLRSSTKNNLKVRNLRAGPLNSLKLPTLKFLPGSSSTSCKAMSLTCFRCCAGISLSHSQSLSLTLAKVEAGVACVILVVVTIP